MSLHVGRADSSSDFTEPEDSEGEKPEKPRRGSGYRPRAGRLNNLLDRGYGANAGSAEENPKANGPEDDFAASDAFWHGLGNNKVGVLTSLLCSPYLQP